MKNIKHSVINRILMFIFSCLLISGCGEVAAYEEEELVITDTTEEAGIYTLVAVTRGDVALTETVSVDYVQAAEQKVVLSSGGKLINQVCVHVGEHVEPGDVLLKLEDDGIQEKIENIDYQIKLNEAKLAGLSEDEKLALEEVYLDYAYNHGLETEDDVKAYEKSTDSAKRQYRYQREDLEDAIEFDKEERAKLYIEQQNSLVCADISGMVYEIEKDLVGSMTKKDQVIMTIVDESDGYFCTKDSDVFSGIELADVYNVHITYGDAAGDYELTPARIGEWGEIQYYDILSEPESSILSVGVSGNMIVPIEEHKDVLMLPNACVHEAGDDRYVYVLDDNGMKTVSFIQIGLVGNDYTEIIDGLLEGDQVVKK